LTKIDVSILIESKQWWKIYIDF